jgi:hypothetical protein
MSELDGLVNSCAKSDSGSDRLVIGSIKSSFDFDEGFLGKFARLTDLKSAKIRVHKIVRLRS